MPIKLPPARNASEVPDLSRPLPTSSLTVKCAGGEFRIDRVSLEGGRRAGVEVIVVDTGSVRAAIIPTRGMSLWRANINGLDLRWQSPIEGPIHPQWVALPESSGLGWLDGFDELLVRCGLRSFGAPEFDKESGRLLFPLHGRIGNLPAEQVELELDAEHSLLHVKGSVVESRFLQFNLRLEVTYTFAIGASTIGIHDRVHNASDTPTTMQLLYHINVGQPLLGAGSQLQLGAKRVVARNDHAANDLESWPKYLGPTAGYSEQVYFSSSVAGADGWATALLTSPDSQRGFAVHYKPETLPYFTQWKNTVGVKDGYVTGLEPGTGFPNPRSFEEQHGRLVALDSGGVRDFNLQLEGLTSGPRLGELRNKLSQLNHNQTETSRFDADWCVPKES